MTSGEAVEEGRNKQTKGCGGRRETRLERERVTILFLNLALDLSPDFMYSLHSGFD